MKKKGHPFGWPVPVKRPIISYPLGAKIENKLVEKNGGRPRYLPNYTKREYRLLAIQYSLAFRSDDR